MEWVQAFAMADTEAGSHQSFGSRVCRSGCRDGFCIDFNYFHFPLTVPCKHNMNSAYDHPHIISNRSWHRVIFSVPSKILHVICLPLAVLVHPQTPSAWQVEVFQHSSKVVQPGRIFIRRIYNLLAQTSNFKPH